jgi:hypothetical protein
MSLDEPPILDDEVLLELPLIPSLLLAPLAPVEKSLLSIACSY